MPGPGSSPLTRGKHATARLQVAREGLIPAHAGKTRSRASWAWRTWAHPRSRGENMALASALSAARGSSPLTRGKLVAVDDDIAGVGLIPAHAGKTRRWFATRRAVGAHPRSRGENQTTCVTCD